MNSTQESPVTDSHEACVEELVEFSLMLQPHIEDVGILVGRYVDTFSCGTIGHEDQLAMAEMNQMIDIACERCASEICTHLQADDREIVSMDGVIGIVFGMLLSAVSSVKHRENMYYGIELRNAYRKIAEGVQKGLSRDPLIVEPNPSINTPNAPFETFTASTATATHLLFQE